MGKEWRETNEEQTDNMHSPNQFHGFSVVQGLKEQFMMRLCGKGTLLTTPGSYQAGNYSSYPLLLRHHFSNF